MWVKLFESWLAEADIEILDWEETSTVDSTPSPTLNYHEPEVSIAKHKSETKFNLVDVILPSGKKLIYSIKGTQVSFSDPHPDLNFKYLKKEKDGALTFGRYVEGGVEDAKIELAEVRPLLRALMSGTAKYSPVTGITFHKIN